MTKQHAVSFVIPVYCSEKTIEAVVDAVAALKSVDWEVVLVNDCSPDNVELSIKRLLKKYPKRIISVKLHINGGQQAAILTGFNYTTKKLVATIDDDGQNPPQEILKLVNKIEADDLDIVYGQVNERKQSRSRKLLSKANIWLSRYTINNRQLIPFSNVRLMRQSIAKCMAQSSAQYNYIEGLAFLLTTKIGYVPIEQRERLAGSSTYNIFILIKLLMNHVIGYSNITLKLLSYLSFTISFLAFMSGVMYFMLTIQEPNRPMGWLSIYFSITVLFSLLFLIMGILTEYIGRMYAKLNQPTTKIIEVEHA